MLHTGSVLLFSWPNKTVGSDAVLSHPESGTITNIALSYQRDIFCSGMSVLPDGRVFIAGGQLYQGVFGGGVARRAVDGTLDAGRLNENGVRRVAQSGLINAHKAYAHPLQELLAR
jgi:hypothetical protein